MASSCTTTSGDVLVSLAGADGGGGGVDASVSAVDASACAAPPECPTTTEFGTVSVCGRVIDLATSQPIAGDGVIAVSFFNSFDFDGDSLERVQPDECGRFVAANISGVLPGFIVMSANDSNLLGGEYVRVVSVLDSSFGQVVRVNAYALRTSREQIWSTTSGLGNNIVDIGALVPIFQDINNQSAPMAGVTIVDDDGPIPANDYYFSSAGSLTRDGIDPALGVTSVDGAGLLTGALVTRDYSGQKAGCVFGTVDGLLPGVIQVQEIPGSCN